MYEITISATSTSSRSTSSRRISVSSRSNGPANTSRSSSRSISRTRRNLAALPDWPHAHCAADIGHRLGGDGASLLGALGERPLECVLVAPTLLVGLPDRRQV